MAGGDISRNIPASRRHLLLDLKARLAPWPGDGMLRARNAKDGTQASYEGIAGRLSITIGRDEDFAEKLASLERIVDHHIERARMVASLYMHKTNPETGMEWDDGSTDTPEWAWVVPDCMKLAVANDKPGGARNRIQDQLARAAIAWTGREHSESWSGNRMKINPHPSVGLRVGHIPYFSIAIGDKVISWGAGRHYLKIPFGLLPLSAYSAMPGTQLGKWIDHPLIDPRTIVTTIKREMTGQFIQLAKQNAVLSPAPLQDLEEVLEVERRMHEQCRSM